MRRLLAVGVAFALGLAAGSCSLVNPPVTLVSLSPDDQTLVELVERPAWLDRNFEVRRLVPGQERRVLFRSPDEGRPVGSERVVWAADGSRFLLLGRHFFVTAAGELPGGEQAYLLADVRTGEVRCNARQGSGHLGFTVHELRAIRWLGWAPPAPE